MTDIITTFFISLLWPFKKLFNFWNYTPHPTYSIYFTIKDKDILFINKTYSTKDQYEYDCEQLVQIAKNPLKNIHLRSSDISYITIKDNSEELMKVRITE
jgi:hypothetical protein